MRLFLTSIVAAMVLSAIVIGMRMVWHHFYPPTEPSKVETPAGNWLQTWNGRAFLIVLLLTFLAVGLHRMTTVQQSPNNLERPPSREPAPKKAL
ncbi:MAG: hypothetical protein HQL79_08330 [Magnetococcales bacterium]|nr:hypothetical protein [Magnetococcales bacterium]